MAGLDEELAENRRAVESFLRRAARVPSDKWPAPRAPGEWTPGQVAEHVALSYEVSGNVVAGRPSMGGVPRLLRPLVRVLFLKPLLRSGRFPRNAKAPPPFQPSAHPPPVQACLDRLRQAAADFEADVRRCTDERVEHPVFGRIPLADYVRLTHLHTRHHEAQLPDRGA